MKRCLIVLCSFYLLLACSEAPLTSESKAVTPTSDSSIARIENGLRKSVQLTGEELELFSIESRLEHHKIPGISIAVAFKGELLWSKGYGLADISQAEKMTSDTMLLAGSISKPVAALRALQLHDEGRLLLDVNINSYLTSWKVPENEFTETEKVTLRRILNHTAGLTVWGFPGYDKGDEVPSTIEVLDGEGNTDAVRVFKTPGESWQYSGGGYTVMQLAVADIEKAPFAQVLQTHVLNPLDMNKSTFENPLPKHYHSLAATGYRSNLEEVEGKWPIYPEMAAAGLWTTPSQLLQYGIEIQRIIGSQQDGIIAYDTALDMLTAGENDHGLGPVVTEHTFRHGGADEGFRASFVAWKNTPYVAVVMVNSDNNAIINETLRSIANEYKLPGYEQTIKTVVKQPQAHLETFVADYDSGDDGIFEVTLTERGLRLYVVNFDFTVNLLPQSATSFFDANTGIELEFEMEDDQPSAILWRGQRIIRVNDGG